MVDVTSGSKSYLPTTVKKPLLYIPAVKAQWGGCVDKEETSMAVRAD